MKRGVVVCILAASLVAPLLADEKDHGKPKNTNPNSSTVVPPGHGGTPPGLAAKDKVPPGLAKKGGMPPGLAKKFGYASTAADPRVYVAFDPQRDDRAWILREGRWIERRAFAPELRLEVRQSLLLPRIPAPPVPPPIARLHVVLFGS